MKKIKLTLSMIFLILMSILVYSLVVDYVIPIDEFYLIKDGAVMGDIIFEVNATPTGLSGIIHNVTLYTNLSGTWQLNYTNDTTAVMATITNRIFLGSNLSILSKDLPDGLVFIWNALACDNISKFYYEDVSLDADKLVVFNNYTGACANCSNAVIITAGKGRLSYYPTATLDGAMNTTRLSLNNSCVLNYSDSIDGFFYCNQTRKTYNSSDGLLKTENLISSTVKINYTINSTCRFAGVNRTVYVEDAPSINLTSPIDNSYKNGTILFGYNVSGDSDIYTCELYSNDTGSWIAKSGGFTAINATDGTTSKVISEKNGVIWNIRCAESSNSNIYGWSINNRTITVDETNPVINSSVKSYSNDNLSKGSSGYINLTVVDNNADTCTLYVDGLANGTISYTSGTAFAMFFNRTDAEYNISSSCNDSIGLTTFTLNTSMTIDTITPGMSRNVNYSSSAANCKGFTVDFTFSEEVNATFKFGTTSMAQTHTVKETDFSTNQTVTLTFNNTYETDYYANITFKDRAGNLNDTMGEMIIPSPVSHCTGWTLWSIYDSYINLSRYRADSGADYVYYWNNTGQSWIFSADAGSNNPDHLMNVGDVVSVYENTNNTFFRNNSGTPSYYVNISNGHAYFGLYHAYTLGNISHNIFLNVTGGNSTPSNIWTGGVEFRIDYISSFNNSNQLFVDSFYKFDWNNLTKLGPAYLNGLDTLWAFVEQNLSINFTPGGEVIGNWT